MGFGEGRRSPSPVYWAGGYDPIKIFKRSTLKSRIFCIFASWKWSPLQCRQGRIRHYIITVLPPGTIHPQLRATRPPGLHRVWKKQADLFLSELRQISIDFNNFWRLDGKMSEILRGVFIFHLTWSLLPHYLVKRRSPKFAVNNDYVVSIMGSSETTTSYHTIKRSGEVSS